MRNKLPKAEDTGKKRKKESTYRTDDSDEHVSREAKNPTPNVPSNKAVHEIARGGECPLAGL